MKWFLFLQLEKMRWVESYMRRIGISQSLCSREARVGIGTAWNGAAIELIGGGEDFSSPV
jgi:hypothetical protein